MSTEIRYKGERVAMLVGDETRVLETEGKYCEADIEVENTEASIQLMKTVNGSLSGQLINPDSGYEAVKQVLVNPIQLNLQTVTDTVTSNGTKTYTPSASYDGIGSVQVTTSVPQPSGSTEITENGTYDVTQYASAIVNVSGGGGGITDLTGTTWVFKDTITKMSGWDLAQVNLNLTGTTNNFNFTNLYYFNTLTGTTSLVIQPQLRALYNWTASSGTIGWQDNAFKTIHFTGGSGATNTAIIAWVQANADQVQPIQYVTGRVETYEGQNNFYYYNENGEFTHLYVATEDDPKTIHVSGGMIVWIARQGDNSPRRKDGCDVLTPHDVLGIYEPFGIAYNLQEGFYLITES